MSPAIPTSSPRSRSPVVGRDIDDGHVAVDFGSVKVVGLENHDILDMQGVRCGKDSSQPSAGVNSISPEWQMNPLDDSSTNFLFAMRLAGANSRCLAQFVKSVPKKGDWNFKKYKSFLQDRLEKEREASEVVEELAFLEDTAKLSSKTAGVLEEATRAFRERNSGIAPSYGDILAIDIPAGLEGSFPGTWRTIFAALGPDCGCRSKRPFVPAFRTELPRNIELVGEEGRYRYTQPNEDPTLPTSTEASRSVLFALFLRLLLKAHSLGHSAVLVPQIGLSVFNHDAAVAQEMIALAARAYSSLVVLKPGQQPLVLYITTNDKPAEVERISGTLRKSLLRWREASDEQLASEVFAFLQGLRKIPKPHVRPEGASAGEPPLFVHDPAEPPAFSYDDAPECQSALDEGVASWERMSRFFQSDKFLH